MSNITPSNITLHTEMFFGGTCEFIQPLKIRTSLYYQCYIGLSK